MLHTKDYKLGIKAVLVHRLFEDQVARSPGAVAVDFEGEQLTYQDLNCRANQLAHHLQALGVGPDVLVGICVERSLEMIVALLGILKAGGAYVPLDPTYPVERLTFMLSNAQAPILLTQSHLVGNWQQGTAICLDTDWQAIACHSTANPNIEVTPDHLAYVIYTSGSTGQPKGVAMAHHPLVNLIAWQLENSVVAGGAKTLQFTPISFDVSLQEIFATLAAGGTLMMISDETRRDPVSLLRFLNDAAIERLFLPFVALRQLAEVAQMEGFVPTHLKEVITAGEQLRITSAISHWFSQVPCTLHNHYGPSESHVVTAFTLTGSPNEWSVLPPIGRPIANSQIYLLDSQLQPVAIGVAGELYIGGVSLARGYLNRPDLTAERFIANPFSPQSGKLYKTGDLARYLPDGKIEYLGRVDQQVKIRGFRIEPGEIEAVLEQHPVVREVVVIAREDVPGDKRLVAYVVSSLVPDRIPYQTDCFAELDGKVMKLRTQDISNNGFCLLGVPPSFSKGKEIRLRLRLPIEREERWLKGIVAWCEGQQAGIQFELVPSEQGAYPPEFRVSPGNSGLLNILQRTFTGNLRDYLKQKLPDYMIPSVFIVLKALPLTPSGKVDRRALPAPTGRRDLENLVAPRTSTEALLAEIWAEILGLEQVGIHDHFLELGGHSLLATQVVSRIRDVFQVELPLRCLFESPTVSELAKYLETAHQEARSQNSSIQPLPRDADLPLSFVQEQLWFIDQLVPNNPFYNVPEAFRLDGSLNITALEQSFQEIINRHETLRTTFTTVDGKPVQVIHPSPTFRLSVVDLHELSTVERETTAWKFVTHEAQKPFDLSQGSLLRATLFKLSETQHILFLNLHHIICDEWSISVLMQELAKLYTAFSLGQIFPLPALTIQYADYAVWQRQWLQGEIRESQLDYWQQQLSDRLPVLQLPTDYPRPLVPTYRGARQFLTLSAPLTEKLKNLSRCEGVTLFMTLLAAFQTLLFHYTRQEDILVGSPIASRHRSELEGVIGFFLNTLVLRTNLSGFPSFRQLLVRVREVALGAYAHQDLPFEQLVQALQPDRDLNQNPLFQVLFSLQNSPMPAWEVPDLTLTRLPGIDNQTAKFDLFLELAETPTGITGYFEYSTDLFEAATITRMIGHFQTLLEGIVTNPDQKISSLPLLTATEQQQLVAWNYTRTDYPQAQCVQEFFEAQAEQTPETVAVEFASQQLTYRELNTKANQLAHHLQILGVGPDVLVGICVERSLEMIVALLGILKAGGAYVPLDPTYPAERLTFMLSNAQAPILLTQSHLMGNWQQGTSVICLDTKWEAIASHYSTANPKSEVTADDLAYVIYTSGSTGKPKGVAMPHRPLSNLLAWQLGNSVASAKAKTLQFTPISFDVSFQEIFATLGGGGTLVLISEEMRRDSVSLLRFLNDAAIERLFLPFVALQHLANVAETEGVAPASLREVITAGEQLRITSAISNWFSQLPNCTLHNHYGPSESHVVTAFTLTGSPKEWSVLPPIGRPIANAQIYLLDEQQQPVAVGVGGEVYIGGISLARGYLNRPDLTTERFISNSFGKQLDRLYKTGDLARYLPDGNIEYLGRIDQQVKIRGFRIEPGEIEAVLEQHPQVREAVVIAREDVPGDKRLVAYVVHNSASSAAELAAPSATQLRQFLQTQMPEYMVPATVVQLDRLPLTPSGKVDRRALPAPDRSRPELEAMFVPATTAVEKILTDIWIQVLNIEQVGIYDNFFALGGYSLRGIQLVARVREDFQVDLTLRSFFESPTIAGLAQIIAAHQAGASAPSPNNSVLDLNTEAVLDPTINPKAALIEVVGETNIFLTGATGFLGAFLLHELLEQTQANIYCLVRAANTKEGSQRLHRSLESYSLWNQSRTSRIIPVVGDLSLPLFGLSFEQFQSLTETIDIIYHNGGLVNFIYPYSVLKAPNVLGTQEVLRLASQTKVKPVHFVSTVGVFSPTAYGESQVIREQEADRTEGLYGYTQSKWVAEKLITIARERGLPTYIYRPTWVEGHSQTGVCNSSDFLRCLIKGCIQLGLAPDWNMEVDIIPVDYISGAIVHLSRQQASCAKVFHISNPQSISWNQLVKWIREFGYPLQQVPYTMWIAEVMDLVHKDPRNALYPFLAFLSEKIPQQQMSVPEIYFQASAKSLRFDCQNTLDGLLDTAITCPPVDDKLLTTYFSYFIRSGFLQPPQIDSESVFERESFRLLQR